jgi:hypothetical protein
LISCAKRFSGTLAASEALDIVFYLCIVVPN